MKFHFQRFGLDVEWHAVADQLMTLHSEEDYASPMHLREQLEATIAHNELPLTVGMHNGIINIHGPKGILLRARSTT